MPSPRATTESEPGTGPSPLPGRDPGPMLERVRAQWGGRGDLWVFGYASLIWRPEFDAAEARPARVHGWHRALKMWSRVNRGTPEFPGLVFALLSGGACKGMVYRVKHGQVDAVLDRIWEREMVTGVYDPKWLPCRTEQGAVTALAFTLSRRSPSYTGRLLPDQYARIFARASGRFGTTLEYAQKTLQELRRHGVEDHALRRLLSQAQDSRPDAG